MISNILNSFTSLTTLILLLAIFSCSDVSTYDNRLKSFYDLLDAPSTTAFESGDIPSVANYLDNKIKDAEFMKKYQSLKEKEAIDLFDNFQTVEFFYKYFYLKKVNE